MDVDAPGLQSTLYSRGSNHRPINSNPMNIQISLGLTLKLIDLDIVDYSGRSRYGRTAPSPHKPGARRGCAKLSFSDTGSSYHLNPKLLAPLHRHSEGAEDSNNPSQDAKKYIFNKNAPNFFIFSAQNPAHALSDHSVVRSAVQEECTLQENSLQYMLMPLL